MVTVNIQRDKNTHEYMNITKHDLNLKLVILFGVVDVPTKKVDFPLFFFQSIHVVYG